MRKATMNAEAREKSGKGVVNKIRRTGGVPGIVYGGDAGPMTVTLDEKEVRGALKAGVRILDLRVGKDSVSALLKAVQYDHLGEKLIHVDFQRLVKGDAIQIRVPIVYKGTPVGLKEEGVFNVLHDTLEVSCQPEDVPDRIEVDVTRLEMGDSLHVSDLALPPGVEAEEEGDTVVAVVTYADTEEETTPAPEEASTQPEVIGEAERKAAADAKTPETGGGGGGKKEKKE